MAADTAQGNLCATPAPEPAPASEPGEGGERSDYLGPRPGRGSGRGLGLGSETFADPLRTLLLW